MSLFNSPDTIVYYDEYYDETCTQVVSYNPSKTVAYLDNFFQDYLARTCPKCTYLENRFEILIWACEELETDPEDAYWIDGNTGERFYYNDLEAEYRGWRCLS